MEENYERRLSEIKQESAYQDYKNDMKKVKNFCKTLNKQGKQSLIESFETTKNK